MAFIYRFVGGVFSGIGSLRTSSTSDDGDGDRDYERWKQTQFVEILRCVSAFQSAVDTKEYDSKEFTDGAKLIYETRMQLENAPVEQRRRLQTELVELLTTAKVIPLFAAVLQACVDQGLPSRFYQGDRPQMGLINPVFNVVMVVQTLADCSATAARLVPDTGMLPSLARVLTEAKEEVLGDGAHNQVLRKLVELVVCLLYHTVKHEEVDLVDTIHSAGLVDAMRPYLRADDVRLRMCVLMFFAYVVNEAEAADFCSDEESLRELMENLEKAMQNRNQRSNGHHRLELLAVVGKLSALDLKTRLGRLGVVDLMRTVVAAGSVEEVEAAVRVIWHLAYDSRSAFDIQERELDGLILTRATAYRSSRLKRTSFNIKMTADRSTVSTRRAAEAVDGCSASRPVSDAGQHIMISYSHNNAASVLPVKAELVKAGYKVWIDEQDMRGSLTEAMSAAVQDSWLFLACSSRSYKDSPYCRMELEYAHEQDKRICYLMMDNFKPDGWLGFLLGKSFYYDFHNKPFDSTMATLLSHIRGWAPQHAERANEAEVAQAEESAVCAALDRSICRSEAPDLAYLDDWSTEDVRAWCAGHDIDWTEEMEPLTGEVLRLLADMQRTDGAKGSYYRWLESLQFKRLQDMTKFDKALKRL